jgi:hypothetical protein
MLRTGRPTAAVAAWRGRRHRFAVVACAPPSSPPPRAITTDPLRLALASGFPNALLLDATPLPDLRASRHFVNLTNGAEALPTLERLGLPYRCACACACLRMRVWW